MNWTTDTKPAPLAKSISGHRLSSKQIVVNAKTLLTFCFALMICFCAICASSSLQAEEPKVEKTPLEKYLEQQQADSLNLEDLQLAEPKSKLTEADQKQNDALAHYLTARLLFNRNAHKQALSELQKAADLAPATAETYELLIPLAIGLNQAKLVDKYVSQAENADPENYQLLLRVGRYMQRQNRFDEAIRLMKRAADSPRLNKKSGEYVMLQFELGILLSLTRKQVEACKSYEVVFDALVHPENYELNAQVRSKLMADRSRSLERIGRVFLDGERLDLAEKAFEAASQFGTGKPGILGYNLASVYLRKTEYAKALENLQAYFEARLQNKGREAYQLLAQILEKLEKTEELIPRLESLSEKDPRNAKLKYFLAEQYIKGNKLDDAEKLVQTTLDSSGGPEGLMHLAEIYFQRRQAEQLLDTISRAFKSQQNLNALQKLLNRVEKDTELTKSLLDVGEKRVEDDLTFEGCFLLGKLAEAAHRTELVSKLYSRAISQRKDKSFTIYQAWGEYMMQSEEFELAVKVWKAAATEVRLTSYRPIFLSRMTDAHIALGQYEEALKSVKQARAIRDTDEFHFQEAWANYRAKNDERAIELFEQFRKKQIKNPRLLRSSHLILSNIYVQRGDIKNGEAVLEELLKLDPDNPTVNNDLGYLYADQGKNLDAAEAMIRKAVKAEPENAAFLDSLGWVLFKLEKYEEAIVPLKKAIEILKEADPTIGDHLADCYHALGQTDEAIKQWTKALAAAQKSETPNLELIEKIKSKLPAPAKTEPVKAEK